MILLGTIAVGGEGFTQALDALSVKASAAQISSGICGDNLTWTLEDDGTFTVSGTGNMYNYSSSSPVPWNSYSTEIRTVIIDNGVESIGNYAFYDCVALISVTLPGSVKSIGYYAFYNCTILSDVYIDNYEFRYGSIDIGSNNSQFENATKHFKEALISGDFYYEVAEDGVEIIHYKDDAGPDVTIPSEIAGKPVVRIGEAAFQARKITSVSMPASVTSIKNDAFALCPLLKTVNFSDHLTDIGDSAFYGCIKIEELTIPDSVTSIGDNAFGLNLGLKHVKLSNSLTEIPAYCFHFCLNLLSIEVPRNVTKIGDGAFSFTPLYRITFYGNIQNIGVVSFLNDVDEINELENDEGKANQCAANLLMDFLMLAYAYSEDDLNGLSLTTTDFFPDIKVYYSCSQDVWNRKEVGAANSRFTNAEQTHFNEPHNHIPGEPVVPQPVVTDCTAGGTAEEIYYCSLCGKELRREQVAIPPTAHTEGAPKRENVQVTSCAVGGTYDLVYYCEICKKEVRRETVTVAPGEHIYGGWSYDGNPYDGATTRTRKCTICGTEDTEPIGPLSADKSFENERDGVQIECGNESFEEGAVLKTVHFSFSDVANDFIFEAWNVSLMKDGKEIQPTTPIVLKLKLPEGIREEIKNQLQLWHNVDGEWILMKTWFEGDYICFVTDSLSPFSFTTDSKEPNANTVFVGEIGIPATCTTDGSYDEVCYLTKGYDRFEISRTSKGVISALGHDFSEYVYNNDATTEEDGTETAVCSRCGEKHTRVKQGTKLPSTNPVIENTNPVIDGFGIVNSNKGTLKADYKSTVIFHTTANAPDGYKIVWSNGQEGPECKFTATKSEYKISAKLVNISTGDTVQTTEEVTVKVSATFIAKIIAFFKGLFHMLPTYVDFKKQ